MDKKILKKIKNKIQSVEYGRINIKIHQGEVTCIEKLEKDKIN